MKISECPLGNGAGESFNEWELLLGEMDLPCLHLQLPVQAGAAATWAVESGTQLLAQKLRG